MSSQTITTADFRRPTIYQIKLRGHLCACWADWFDSLTITLQDTGDTLLTGPVADQSALYGLLKKVRDLGMPLLLVHCLGPAGEGEAGANVAESFNGNYQ